MEHIHILAGTLYDRWTRTQLVSELGTAMFEYIERLGYLDYHYVIFPAMYVLIVTLLSFILHRIHFTLPLFIHILIIVYTSYDHDGWQLKDGYYHVIMIAIIFWRWCIKTGAVQKEYKDPDLYQLYHGLSKPIGSYVPQAKISGVHISIIILIMFLGLIVTGNYYGIDHNFMSIMPFIIILLASEHIPGVGGNSTTGIVAIIAFLIIGLLAIPDILQLLIKVLTAHFTPPISAPAQVNVPAQFMKFVNFERNHEVPNISITGASLCDMMRAIIGIAMIAYMACDDFMGPSHLIKGASVAKNKDKPVENPTILAGFFDSGWIITSIVNIAWCLVTGEPLSVLLLAIGAGFGWFTHHTVGSKTWSARGQALTLTNLRDGMTTTFGTGASGFRRLVFMSAALIAVLLMIPKIGTATCFVFIILTIMAQGDERVLTGWLGLITYNPGLVLTAFLNRQPITGTIESNSINAYSPTIGGNTGPGRNTPPDLNVESAQEILTVPPSILNRLMN